MKRIILLCSLLALVSTASGQKHASEKFDEFALNSSVGYFFDDEISFKERLSRFQKHLKSERGKKVYIIYYQPRILSYNESWRSRMLADRAQWEIGYETSIKHDDIQVIDGGHRHTATIEFWVGDRNGRPPKPTPSFRASETFKCPSISVYQESPVFDPKDSVVFSLLVSPKTDARIKWSISEGLIVEGAGSPKIKVDPKEATRVTAVATVEGVQAPCNNSAVVTADIGPKAYLFDAYGEILLTEVSARLDGFLAAIGQDPKIKGEIIIYGNRNKPSSLTVSVRVVKNHLNFRGFPIERLTIAEGGYRETTAMELWLVPSGVKRPEPTPTVNSKFVRRPVRKSRVRKRR